MYAANFILGAVVLLFGRRLFWVFVAVVGFLVGADVAGIVLESQPFWMQILVGVTLGVVGAIAAVIVERVGFALAGFYAVGYLSMVAAAALQPETNLLVWFFCGGVVGGVVAALLMDWAIIVLSSAVGAAAIATSLSVSPLVGELTFCGLTILGIAVQSRTLRNKRRAAAVGTGTHGQVQHAA